MPYFSLETNISRAEIPDNFMTELAVVLAKTLRKPAHAMIIRILPDQLISFQGVDGPCGQACLRCIGRLGKEENIKHSKVISEKVAELGINPSRLHILFQDIPSYAIGVDGTTCDVKYGSLLQESTN